MGDYFTIRCSDCRCRIRIYSVAVFKPGFYSYGYGCKCGCVVEVDGVAGEGIPESLRRRAEHRRGARNIRSEIDCQRRDLPQSDVKRLLRDSRLPIPEQAADGVWVVYVLPDQRRISYAPDLGIYSLSEPDGQAATFAGVEEVVRHLETS